MTSSFDHCFRHEFISPVSKLPRSEGWSDNGNANMSISTSCLSSHLWGSVPRCWFWRLPETRYYSRHLQPRTMMLHMFLDEPEVLGEASLPYSQTALSTFTLNSWSGQQFTNNFGIASKLPRYQGDKLIRLTQTTMFTLANSGDALVMSEMVVAYQNQSTNVTLLSLVFLTDFPKPYQQHWTSHGD